ncbi:MAG: hypothetical protein WA160_05375 [Pseudobdellovibrio sp.]
MEKIRVSESGQDKIKSISHALSVLNDAADDSAQEIRNMVNTDYNKLKRVLNEVKPGVKVAFSEIKDVAADSMTQAKDKVVLTSKEAAQKVDDSVHQKPWVYLGGVAAASVLAGYLLGKKTKQ